MLNSYFPNDKPAQAGWYINMHKEFPDVAATLGFSPAETTPDWRTAPSPRTF